MADILLKDHGGEADVVMRSEIANEETDNADLRTDEGIGNAVYLSLFCGGSWADGVKTAEEQISGRGEMEELLNAPLSAGAVREIKLRASTALQWLVSDNIVSSLEVAVRNPAAGLIEIDILTKEPNSVDNRYKLLWDQQTQRVTAFYRNP